MQMLIQSPMRMHQQSQDEVADLHIQNLELIQSRASKNYGLLCRQFAGVL